MSDKEHFLSLDKFMEKIRDPYIVNVPEQWPGTEVGSYELHCRSQLIKAKT